MKGGDGANAGNLDDGYQYDSDASGTQVNDASSEDQSPGYGDSATPNWLSWFTSLDGH